MLSYTQSDCLSQQPLHDPFPKQCYIIDATYRGWKHGFECKAGEPHNYYKPIQNNMAIRFK